MSLRRIFKKGKTLILAYDQGLEHGPSDFNDKNVDPLYVIDIAYKGKFNALVLQKGIAEKYHQEIKKRKINLILKLNGKTNLVKGEPISRQLCSVKEALNLGAIAVGYTIYLGSKYESIMLKEFEKIEEEAHSKKLPVIAWIYPRGKSIKGKNSSELMAYSCRVGLEIGADIIKIKYNGKKDALKWAIKNAGRTKVVIAGGPKKDEKILFKEVTEIVEAGAAGLAIGRNIWQSPAPLELTKKIKKLLWKNEV